MTEAVTHALVGTSGYAYKEWKGSFYPEDLGASDMLRYYAGRFATVEINNTFYRMPTEQLLVQWAEQVPQRFAFVIKASRRITHLKRLNGVGDEVEYLVRTLATLGERLGPVLFQLPPNLKKDLDRLSAFLDLLPERLRAALEFRNQSWFDADVRELLRERNVAMVASDAETGEDTSIERTADWGYLRLRREEYSDDELAHWAGRIREQGWKDAFVFFKHEDEGTGPKLAARFLECWGQ